MTAEKPPKLRPPTDTEEARFQKQIAADPDKPGWTDEDFAMALPLEEVLPDLQASLMAGLAQG